MVWHMAAAVQRNFRMSLPVAIISNEQTPYRVHLHRRIAAECPELCLWSVFTHELSSSPWQYRDIADIRPVMFGRGEASSAQADILRARHEWNKGGEVIAWMKDQAVRAVVLLGYNDAGRLRIARWCRRHRIPCFLFGDSNIRCDQAAGWRAAVKAMLVPRIIRLCTGVFHCGSLGREYFLRYGAEPERLFPFPYEPDYSRFLDMDPTRIAAARQRFGLAPGKRHLLYSGRLVSVKRVDLLLRAFAAVADQRPDWNLVVAGSGPLRQELGGIVPPSLRDRVIWTGFVESVHDLAAIYGCADVLAVPSDYEPWGVVVTEAAAAGLAIVASSIVGAAADVVEDGVNGRIFRRGDVAHFSECLLHITSPSNVDRARAASRTVLGRWRMEADPVEGLRRALASAGLPIDVAHTRAVIA